MEPDKSKINRVKNSSHHSNYDVDGNLRIGDEDHSVSSKNHSVNKNTNNTEVNFHFGLNKYLIGVLVFLISVLLGVSGYKSDFWKSSLLADTNVILPQSEDPTNKEDQYDFSKKTDIPTDKQTTKSPRTKEAEPNSNITKSAISKIEYTKSSALLLSFSDNHNDLHQALRNAISQELQKTNHGLVTKAQVNKKHDQLVCRIDIQESEISVGIRKVPQMVFNVTIDYNDNEGQLLGSKNIQSDKLIIYNENEITQLFNKWIKTLKNKLLPL